MKALNDDFLEFVSGGVEDVLVSSVSIGEGLLGTTVQ
jgi:hypothetical protein